MKKLCSLLVFAGALLVGGNPAALAAPLRLAFSTWVGYGPFYVAQAEGYFKDEGLDVEMIKIEDPKVRVPTLIAGKIDALATTIDTIPPYVTDAHKFKYIFAIDDSDGGDGIVADKSIKTIADLKGKKVAYDVGSTSNFYLATVLRQVGLSIKDVDTVNMTAGDAGGAFVAGRVDAAVTWEPWLTRGKQAPQGHLLDDSSKHPGLITDVAVTTPAVLAARKADFMALARAWNKAVAFVRAHPEQADAIMAKGVGGWLKDPKVFAGTRTGIKFYGAADNKAFFGTAAKPGPILDTIKGAINLWTETGRMQSKPDPKSLVAFEFVNQ